MRKPAGTARGQPVRAEAHGLAREPAFGHGSQVQAEQAEVTSGGDQPSGIAEQAGNLVQKPTVRR